MTETSEAYDRVAEFVRQWILDPWRADEIYGVHFDINAEPARLYVTDLLNLLADVID